MGSVGSVHFRIVSWSGLYFSRSIGPFLCRVGGGCRMGTTFTPVADACWCMAKPIQYFKVKKNNNKKITIKKTCSSLSALIWDIVQWFSKCVLSPAASASPGNLLEIQILRSCSCHLCFNKLSSWFWCLVKFANYWSGPTLLKVRLQRSRGIRVYMGCRYPSSDPGNILICSFWRIFWMDSNKLYDTVLNIRHYVTCDFYT